METMNGNTYTVPYNEALSAAIEQGKLIQGHTFQVDCYCKLNDQGDLVLMQAGFPNINNRVVPMSTAFINQMFRIMDSEDEL